MKGTKWALGLVMMVFGLLLMTQLRVQQNMPNNLYTQRSDDLAAELKATQARLKAAEAERDRLTAEFQKQPGQAAPAPDTTPLQLLAGTIQTQGPGVIVTLVENTEVSAKTRVQDEDVWLVLNELLASGAEGLAVNGQRITAVSGIRNVGNRVIIYQTMTNSPFEIAAIGDPAVMEAALRLRGGVVDALDKWGIKVTISRSDAIRLPAFSGVPLYRYARPVK